MYYTVSETAKKLNISPHTLRFYSKEGLLPFVDRSESGIRMFKTEDFEWLFIIDCLKKTGMPIKQIKQFIDWCLEGDSTIDQRLGMFAERQETVEKQIAELKEALDVIKYKRWLYEVSKSAGTTSVLDTLKLEDYPEDIRIIKERINELHGVSNLKDHINKKT
ncbi:MAG: MerR family transcriptional regulator [Peptococcaceae bacterium]